MRILDFLPVGCLLSLFPVLGRGECVSYPAMIQLIAIMTEQVVNMVAFWFAAHDKSLLLIVQTRYAGDPPDPTPPVCFFFSSLILSFGFVLYFIFLLWQGRDGTPLPRDAVPTEKIGTDVVRRGPRGVERCLREHGRRGRRDGSVANPPEQRGGRNPQGYASGAVASHPHLGEVTIILNTHKPNKHVYEYPLVV